jgi:hypothetical protein
VPKHHSLKVEVVLPVGLTCVSMYAVRLSSLVPHTFLSSRMGTA